MSVNSFYQQNIGCLESFSTMFISLNRLWTQFRAVTMNQLIFSRLVSLSGSKNETSRFLTYKIFWWKKKLHQSKVPREMSKKNSLTFVFKILQFEKYRQLTKSCWGKKCMKRKTLHGTRYVNKKIIKNKMIQSCERDLFYLL